MGMKTTKTYTQIIWGSQDITELRTRYGMHNHRLMTNRVNTTRYKTVLLESNQQQAACSILLKPPV
jgi:hypothetical protein